MNRDLVVGWLGLALGLSLLALAYDATLAFAGGVSAVLTLVLVLGATKGGDRGDLGPFAPWFAASFLVWVLAFAAMHLLPQTTTSPDDLWLGLPPATAAMVYGLWIAPLVTATLPYALHFDRFTLTEEQMATVEAAAEMREEAARARRPEGMETRRGIAVLEPVGEGEDGAHAEDRTIGGAEDGDATGEEGDA